jgi:hypothetical protein
MRQSGERSGGSQFTLRSVLTGDSGKWAMPLSGGCGILALRRMSVAVPSAINSAVVAMVGMSDDYGPAWSNASTPRCLPFDIERAPNAKHRPRRDDCKREPIGLSGLHFCSFPHAHANGQSDAPLSDERSIRSHSVGCVDNLAAIVKEFIWNTASAEPGWIYCLGTTINCD